MRVYRMSSIGECPKALVAKNLGYEPTSESKSQDTLLKHATRFEHLVASALTDEGYNLRWTHEFCESCSSEFGDRRYGFHSEFSTFLVRVVGHIDRRLQVSDNQYPLEIKSFGRFIFPKFQKEGFSAFPEYAAQIVCQIHSEKKPGFYAACNRDTGEMLKLSLPYNGEYADGINGFTRIVAPANMDDILDQIHKVELDIQEKHLPDMKFDDKTSACRWCRLKYLCLEDGKQESVVSIESFPTLLEAADLWKEGKTFEQLSVERLEQAKQVFLRHAKDTGVNKYQVGGVKVSFLGERSRDYIDEKRLKELVSEDIIRQATRKGKIWDDIRINLLKEE